MSTAGDLHRSALSDARSAIEDAERPLAPAAEAFRRIVAGGLDEARLGALDRLIDGDPSSGGLAARSIAELETLAGTARRNLDQADERPEAQARWRVELRAARTQLAGRRNALLALSGPDSIAGTRTSAAAAFAPPAIGELSASNVNNTWYTYRPDAATAIVFVHGILSDGKTCWLNEDDPLHPVFWPELVASDSRFDAPAIFLGGFYTAFDSGIYDIRDAAFELHDALLRTDEQGRRLLGWKNILFVAHSTGGIVVRFMLERWWQEFAEKNVGLVLIASPSFGSDLADLIAYVSDLYAQRMARQLRWGNESLAALDDRFKSLLGERRIRNLVGVEAFENHFVLHRKFLWLFNRTFVVEKESAARYFPDPRALRQTNHFTCVKPADRRHPAYELLLDFYTQKFRPLVDAG